LWLVDRIVCANMEMLVVDHLLFLFSIYRPVAVIFVIKV